MSTDPSEVASAFATFYYQAFDYDRKELRSLYRDQSMLTFEGQQCGGVSNIVEKLASLPFQKVLHHISTIDAQPSSPGSGAILISITGVLLIDNESNSQMFSQTFHLIPDGNSYWVYNDIFRLIYS